MTKKKKNRPSPRNEPVFAHRPFAHIHNAVKPPDADRDPEDTEPAAARADEKTGIPDAPEDPFVSAMADVAVLAHKRRPVLPPARDIPPFPTRDDRALRTLDGIVRGTVEFDISDTDEYIEGWVRGLDRHTLRRLRRGDFPYQAHLDLHGMQRAQAKEAVARFIEDAVVHGLRCVLIVHGRGLRSPGGIPVIKESLTGWLTSGPVGKRVLAYTSARPHDGGTGAVYVLLRRR